MESMMNGVSMHIGIGNCGICNSRKIVVQMDGDMFCRQCINNTEHLRMMIGQ